MDPWDSSNLARRLEEALITRRLGRGARVLETVRSTQDDARRAAEDGAPDGALFWALEQTAGRGRLDRTWVSGKGAGLWFSVILRPRLEAELVPFIAIAAGVGIAEGLASAGTREVRLKWPNDLVIGSGKLGGILAEAAFDGARVTFVAHGVGINLVPPSPDGGAEVRAASLAESPATAPDPVLVLAAVLDGLERRYDQLLEEGPGPVRLAWLRLSATIGRQVRAEMQGRTISGRAVELASDGSLVLDLDEGGRVQVHGGDVIHLR